MLSIHEGLRLPTTFLGQTSAALGVGGGLLGLVALSNNGFPVETSTDGGGHMDIVTNNHIYHPTPHPMGPPAVDTSHVDPRSSWSYDGHDSRSVAHIGPNTPFDSSRYVAVQHPDGSGRDLIPLRHK